MVEIWVSRLDCLRPDLTTAGVLGLQSRLSYCEICAATCFRLRGDNLNENPPFYHAYGRPKAGAQTQEVQLDSEVSDLERGSLESDASLVSIKGKYLLGHRLGERGRKDYQSLRGEEAFSYLSPHENSHNVLHIFQKHVREDINFWLRNVIRSKCECRSHCII